MAHRVGVRMKIVRNQEMSCREEKFFPRKARIPVRSADHNFPFPASTRSDCNGLAGGTNPHRHLIDLSLRPRKASTRERRNERLGPVSVRLW